MMKVSTIIINYNTAKMTERVIERLLGMEKEIDFEIILIDNNSSESLPRENFLRFGIEPVYNKENLGFAGAVNQGLKIAKGEYILLLNSDVLVSEGSVSKMIENFKDDIGIIGPQMNFPDGRFQSSFGRYPTLMSELLRFTLLYKIFPGGTFAINSLFKKIDLNKSYIVDWVSGGCMIIKREVIEKNDVFDTGYFLGVEDIDFCLQAKKAGFKTMYCPEAKVVHYHGHSSGGTRSLGRIGYDRDGFDYYFRKNYPDYVLTRHLVRWMHELKMFMLKIFNL